MIAPSPSVPATRYAVVGGGASGALLSIAARQRDGRPMAMTVFEPRDQVGHGLAYSYCRSEHLLNVPEHRPRGHVPTRLTAWYDRPVDGTYAVTMGDRGRLVVPAELRERAGLTEGRPLILLETQHGILLLTRDQLKDLVRADLKGLDLVQDLLAGRRREAKAEDAA